jgi:hypothetical protein
MRASVIRSIIFCVSVMLFSACSTMGVEAWERDILAKDEMQLVADPLEAAIDDHIYFSKEASSGGRGFGGGGCGCN